MSLRLVACCLLAGTMSVFASANSMIGGMPMQNQHAHEVFVGYTSSGYNWWNRGDTDWYIGGEIVYGDWAAEFSDVSVGAAINGGLRWSLRQSGNAHVAFRFSPGLMFAEADASDSFVLGVRGELAVPISIVLDEKINLVTGVSSPISILFVEDVNDFVILPILARLGVEVDINPNIIGNMLFELGPTIGVGGGNADVEFGLRFWMGATFF